MFTRALPLSLAVKRAVGVRRCVDGIAHSFRLQPPSITAAAAAISRTDAIVHHHQRYNISTSPPLRSSPNDEEGGEKAADDDFSDEKRAMIQRWMKWNTSKTWRYEPNPDLIEQIGKEGTSSPLDQFRDTVSMEKRETEEVGRSWSAKELRRKSYDDLHKLWYVLYKEKNMLLTEGNLARRHGYELVQPNRRKKVVKSMGAVKHVMGERKRKKIGAHKAYLKELKRFDGLMAKMKKLEGDGIEEAMDAEAEKMSSKETL